MLTDATLKHLKPKKKPYKVADRDGIYVVVSPTGSITFRLDYRINNRRETLRLAAMAATASACWRRASWAWKPGARCGKGSPPPSRSSATRPASRPPRPSATSAASGWRRPGWPRPPGAMRRSIYGRDVEPAFKNRLLSEIEPADVRALCQTVKGRGCM